METRTAVVIPGLPYVYNIVVMGIHVQSVSLASCALFCWKDKTEFTVQQSAECARTSSKIYHSTSHAQCKTTCFVHTMVCKPTVVSAQEHTALHNRMQAICCAAPSLGGGQVLPPFYRFQQEDQSKL